MGSAGEEVTKTPRMQKGLPISQDSLSTKNKLEEILAGLVAPSKPMAWCPAQLYPKNTQMCQTHLLLGEEDGGEVQAGGCSVARSLQTSMGDVSPHHTELTTLWCSVSPPIPWKSQAAVQEGRSMAWPLDFYPQAHPSSTSQGCASPVSSEVVLPWVIPRGSCYTAAMGISLITRSAEWP